MDPQADATAEREPIGLLVVHGIGEQRKGETAQRLVEGLRAAYPDDLDVSTLGEDHMLVTGLGPPVHVIEAYWADAFRPEDVRGTFDIDRIFELAWFPRLSWSCGLLTAEIVARSRVRTWTLVLAVLSPLIWCALVGANLVASFAQGFREPRERRQVRTRESLRSLWNRTLREQAEESRPRTLIDNLMDAVVGDIFNYVDGRAHSFPQETPQSERLVRSVQEIQSRFERSAQRAVASGCREIQIVAHSLGSVIAFLSMTSNHGKPPRDSDVAQITRIYTIGSPLAKVRFFWPRLFEESSRGLAITAKGQLIASAGATRWDNFYNTLDLVSGRLRSYPGWPAPDNHAVPGLGGVLTAHGAYRANPSFLEFLGEGLGRPPRTVRRSRGVSLFHAALATLQTIAAPFAFAVLAVAGLGVMLGVSWGTGWLVAKPVDLLGFDGVASAIRIYMVASFVFVIFVGSAIAGHSRAKDMHARFWAIGSTSL